ncbi:MAG: AI-2E family transporter [Gammaproteobacteria bacterium]|tara:strand:- start:1480 stop:2541 length:1062 start_codon:yes stop_codon:yes gene_type:complete
MIEHINKLFKRIFNNEETVIFSLVIVSVLILFSLFAAILTPFIISVVVAYLLVGLQKKIQSYNISESLSAIFAFSIFIIVGAAMFMWLIPLIYVQLQSFVLDLPRLFDEFINFMTTLSVTFPDLVNSDQISLFFQSVSSELSSITQNLVKSSIAGIQSTISVLLYIILFPILVYFFFFDRKNIINGLTKIIPGDRTMLSKVWSEMDVQLSNYVRGKALEIIIVGLLAAILFYSFGLKYAALLAFLVGISALIPYVGAFLVTIPIVVIGLLQFGLSSQFYLLLGLYILLQFVDGNILVPIIFSEAVKLHPLVIIFAVFLFGSMFGFWGVFFSIPLATFIKAVWNSWPGVSISND